MRAFWGALVVAGLAGGSGMARATDVSLRAPRMKAPLARNSSYLRGLRLDLRGDHAAAAEAYKVAARRAGIRRARFHYKVSLAIAKLRGDLGSSPDSYDRHFNLGVNLQNKYWALYLDLGIKVHRLFALAEHHFRRAMALSKRASNPVICLAALYAQAGDRARGQETMRREMAGRRITPSDRYNLAFYHKSLGEMRAAYRHLRSAFRADGRHRDWVRNSDDFAEYLNDPRMQVLLKAGPQRLSWPRRSGVMRNLRRSPFWKQLKRILPRWGIQP